MRLNIFIFSAAVIIPLFTGCAEDQREKGQKPNIVFIMADDHAVQAISAYGHSVAQLASTPNIDRLADQGALFTANYCANSICGPSRASVLTGKHSHKNGFMRNTTRGFEKSRKNI